MNFSELVPIFRPLVVFDTESTGPNPAVDRICEIGFIWLKPDGSTKEWQSFVNPTIPIPDEAAHGNPERGYTGHGITDDMVKDAPTFKDLAPHLLKGFTANTDYAGFNIKGYDLPLMQAEFQRAGYTWTFQDAHIIDGYRIWQLGEARNLGAAVERFLKRKHEGAHRALDDVRASLDVIVAQLLEFSQLPRDAHALHELSYPVDPNAIDPEGKIIWKNGVATMNFGKKWKDRPLSQIPRRDLEWIAGPDTTFSPEVKRICRDAAMGRLPQPPLKEVNP